ncbi:MAG TPA: 2'-deoxycytidine 5'-triphosphate deaminase [Candidatus Nanoarchaeia archaeon]|nr:2'-deoxycytidine 5'-triphosphate deaminase [Candidatus Nanoarchaeia archaeon]
MSSDMTDNDAVGLDLIVGKCLVDREIKEWLESGKLNFPLMPDEEQVQPSSFEPVIGEEAFLLDADSSIFRPDRNSTIYTRILQLGRRKTRLSLDGGMEVMYGQSYAIPIEGNITLGPNESVRASPKSSRGRLFLNTRLMADYSSSFDTVNHDEIGERGVKLWLLCEPLQFNLVLYPGLLLNQLQFDVGNPLLTPQEVREVLKRYSIVNDLTDGTLTPKNPSVGTRGLMMPIGLTGKHSEGVLALRVRRNPHPIDLKEKGVLPSENYFEPIMSKDGILKLGGRRGYLVCSDDFYRIPPWLNGEIRMHDAPTFAGPKHYAGFFDNGFSGEPVFEVISYEDREIDLSHGAAMSVMDFSRTAIPDKPYGKDRKSHYQGQTGLRVSSTLRPFDYATAAKSHPKLNREVLVQDARRLLRHRKQREGFEPASEEVAAALFGDVQDGFFLSRYECEEDPLVLQPIPYVMIFGKDRKVFSYVRASNIKDYGDKRLFGKHSIGLGGHIAPTDAPHFIMNCLEREVFKEEVQMFGDHSRPKFLGTLMQYDRPVDQVHLGLVFALHAKGAVKDNEASIVSGRMLPLDELLSDPERDSRYETWSKVLVPHLPELYERSLS